MQSFIIILGLILFFGIRAFIRFFTKIIRSDTKRISEHEPNSAGYERARKLADYGIQNPPEPAAILKAPPPIPPDEFFKRQLNAYIAFDLETTGLSPDTCQIIEIGAVKILGGKEVDSFQTLVNPGCHIPEEATAVNHITDEMVKAAPFYSTAIPQFVDFIGDLPLVAHNASFDVRFLYAAFAALNIPKLISFSDSLRMARQCFPGLENKKLGTVCDAIGYQIGNAHRALDDARAVHAIVQACAAVARDKADYEKSYQLHYQLTQKIGSDYDFLRSIEDYSSAQIDAFIGLCQKDFDLVPSVREYCRICCWPEPAFDSFRKAAILLTKLKRYDAAIEVCENALALDVPDRTIEGGMQGRLDKLIAKKKAAEEKETLLQAKAAALEEKKARQAEREAAIAVKSESSTGTKRPVLQFSYDGTELIKEHESLASAAKEIGVDKSCIRDAAKGKQKHAGGFTWKYADEVEKTQKEGAELYA